MAEIKNGDFVEIDLEIYANNKLVQTTNEKLGKENKLEVKEYKPLILILGKSFILKALDEDIIKNKGKNNILNLKTEMAYGRRKKEYLKTFTKSAFEEQKMRPIVGVTYDFNGMYGLVKTIIGGRVLVDFNNPLSGKEIKIVYKNLKKILDIKIKIETIFEIILKIDKTNFKCELKNKEITLLIPEQLLVVKKQLKKSLEELLSEIKDYKLDFKKL